MATAIAARRGASTPAWLWRSLVAVALAAALAGGVALYAAASISGTARTIGTDAEPSVALALRMAAALSDMNGAALADSLTEGGAATGTSETFRAAGQALADDLVQAAGNVTYGEAETGPLRALQRWLLAYQTAVAEARAAASGGAWLAQHRVEWASRVNREFAGPAAAALARANVDELEARYAQYRSGSVVLAAAAGAAFGLLVVVLGVVQLWLAGRVRRLVNPLLAAATVVAAVAGVWFVASALQEREELRAAKSDAYDSLLVLFEAKGAANDLRAGMSGWLLDPALRGQAQADMDATLRRLVAVNIEGAAGAGLAARLREALAAEQRGDAARALVVVRQLGGLLGTEMDNITYGVAERRPASESLVRLMEARTLIGRVQREAVVRPGEGVRLWVEDGTATFGRLQAALDETLRVNQVEFDRHVAAALGMAGWLPWGVAGALLLTVLLAGGGLWQRLREYR